VRNDNQRPQRFQTTDLPHVQELPFKDEHEADHAMSSVKAVEDVVEAALETQRRPKEGQTLLRYLAESDRMTIVTLGKLELLCIIPGSKLFADESLPPGYLIDHSSDVGVYLYKEGLAIVELRDERFDWKGGKKTLAQKCARSRPSGQVSGASVSRMQR